MILHIPQDYKDLKQKFGIYLNFFYYSGLPLMSHENKIYYIYVIITYLIMISLVFGAIADLLLHLDYLSHAMENTRIIFALCVSTWNWHLVSIQRRKIINLMRLATAFTTEEEPPQSEGFTMTRLLPRMTLLTKCVYLFIAIFHVTYCTFRLAVRDERTHTVNAYYGPGTKESPFYELLNLLQIIAAFIAFVPFYIFTCLYGHFVVYACSQLEILQASLKNISQNLKPNNNLDDTKNILEKQLGRCICHHQQIMEYMTALEDTVNPILMGNFFFILMGMCFSAFSFAESWGNTVDMSQSLVAYLCFLGELYVYCWLGNELTNLAESVRDAAWECDWIGAPLPFQRCLIFITAIANKEFIITAGKFVPASRQTMMNVINQTISFLMFLMNVKEDTTTA